MKWKGALFILRNRPLCAPLLATPRHDWHCGDGILRTSFNELLTDGQVDQRVMLLVKHADDLGFFEEDTFFLTEDILLIG